MQYRISNSEATETATTTDFFTVCDRLSCGKTKKLTITELHDDGSEKCILRDNEVVEASPALAAPVASVPMSVPTSPPALAFSDFGSGNQVMDEAALARITEQRKVLAAHGIEVDESEQLFETGVRMARVGYDTQAARKKEWEERPLLADEAEEFRSLVIAERREDQVCTAKDIADSLSITGGKLQVFGLTLREQAVRGLCARLESPALSYLLGLGRRIGEEVEKGDKRDRSGIVADKAKLADVLHYECMRKPNEKVKLRTRGANQDCYAITSESYVPFDGHQMVAALMGKLPKGTKGSYDYDEDTTRWALTGDTFSPLPTHLHAVGELFAAGLKFRSGDGGQDSFRGGGFVLCLRCLNASTYEATTGDGRRTHRGSIVVDAAKIISAASKSIEVLIEAWGLNREAEVPVVETLSSSEFVSALYRSMLRDRSSEFVGVFPGRVASQVPLLAASFDAQRRDNDRIVRSDLAQGLTSYAQGFSSDVQANAEVAVGSWLVRQPKVKWDLDE